MHFVYKTPYLYRAQTLKKNQHNLDGGNKCHFKYLDFSLFFIFPLTLYLKNAPGSRMGLNKCIWLMVPAEDTQVFHQTAVIGYQSIFLCGANQDLVSRARHCDISKGTIPFKTAKSHGRFSFLCPERNRNPLRMFPL